MRVTIAAHDGPLDVNVGEAGTGPPVLLLHGVLVVSNAPHPWAPFDSRAAFDDAEAERYAAPLREAARARASQQL